MSHTLSVYYAIHLILNFDVKYVPLSFGQFWAFISLVLGGECRSATSIHDDILSIAFISI